MFLPHAETAFSVNKIDKPTNLRGAEVKRGIAFLAAMLMIMMVSVTVPASDEHALKQPDYNRKGSVSVTIKTASGEKVGGGKLTLYRVADAKYDNGNNIFVLTPEFAGSKADLTKIETETNGAPQLAKDLEKYVVEKKISGTEKAVDQKSATAAFSDLSLGVYLCVQTEAPEGYEPIAPFCVTVPFWDGKTLLYDVDASPKPQPIISCTPTPSPTPTPTTPPPPIPQTGQLWWPVPLLAFLGAVLFIAGCVIRRRDRDT